MAYDLIGKDFTPPDIEAKVTGRARYSEDFRPDGMVFLKLLTSPMPHARVTNIDASEALAMPGVQTWSAIVGIAALSTALAYVLYFRILATAGATNLLLVTLLVPVSAIVFGSLILGEVLDITHFAGMALIGLGLISIDGRLFVRFQSIVPCVDAHARAMDRTRGAIGPALRTTPNGP